MVQSSEIHSASIEWSEKVGELVRDVSVSQGLILIVGVGHPFRSDDSIGSQIVRALTSSLDSIPENVQIINGQDQPENLLSKFSNHQVKLCILIDALDMNAAPGTIRLLELDDTEYSYFASHNVPLKLILKSFMPAAHALILGVQPEALDFGTTLSPPLVQAKEIIVSKLTQLFQNIDRRRVLQN